MRKILAIGLWGMALICWYLGKQIPSLRMVGPLLLATSVVVLMGGKRRSFGGEAVPSIKPDTERGVAIKRFALELIGAIGLVWAAYYFVNRSNAAGGTVTWPAYFFAGSLLILGWVVTSVFTRFK